MNVLRRPSLVRHPLAWSFALAAVAVPSAAPRALAQTTRAEASGGGGAKPHLDAAKTGHLVVREKGGAPLQVVLDGSAVGTAPYEADVEPGAHEVSLRGPTLAAPAQKVTLEAGKTADVELTAVQAKSHLTVSTTDRVGDIYVDDVKVGEGVFDGDVSVGSHALKVSREGYEPFATSLTLAPEQTLTQAVNLAPISAGPVAGEAAHDDDGVYGGFGVLGFVQPGGNGNDVEERCTALGATSCDGATPLGAGLSGFVGYSLHPFGVELFAEGAYDQERPSASFDGKGVAGGNPLAASVARTEDFYFGRVAFLGAIRGRFTVQSEKVRGSLAAGFGLAYGVLFFDRVANSTNPAGLRAAHGDKAGEAYVSPALSFDGSVGYRLTPSMALTLGVQLRLETAGDDVKTPSAGDQYIGGNVGGRNVAYPIPTPSYRLASGTQAFVGPYLGLQFGP